MSRRPSHPREAACWALLKSQGYEPTGRGFPTFFAWRLDGDRPAFVIIQRGRRIKGTQQRIANVLQAAGLSVLMFFRGQLIPYQAEPRPMIEEDEEEEEG